MTNPGPPGDDERPLAASEWVVLEPDPPAADPLTDDVPPAPPAAQPTAPAYEPVSDSPVYDAVASSTDEFAAIGDTGGAVFGEVGEAQSGGPLGAVKAFAAQRPQVFLGIALAVGFLLGRVFSSSDDEES